MTRRRGKARLLVVSSRFDPAVGGAERQGLELASSLRSRHVPVVVVTLHDGRRKARCGFRPVPMAGVEYPKVRIVGPMLAYWRGILVLRRLAARRPAIAQLQTLDPFTLALGVAALALRVPTLVRISGAYEMNLGYLSVRWGVRRYIARWLLRHATRVFALNPDIERRLLALGVRPERILRVPNAIPDRFFETTRGQAAGDEQSPPAVLQVGRLDPFKGGSVMLRAWQIVAGQRSDGVLRFVGDGPERAGLETLSRELGIAPRVVFCGTSADPRSFYAAADVFVLPSLEEGMPNALLEAMATGLACVASDLPGTRGIVEHGRSGLLVPPGDADSLGAAVARLLADGGERKRLGQAARERVRPLAMSRLVQSHLDLHNQVCGLRPGVARGRD